MMQNVQLFLDDVRLFRRENLERRNTPMELVGEYIDEKMNVVFPSGYIFTQPDGTFRLFYSGTIPGGDHQLHYFTAVSNDGIHFQPDNEAAERVNLQNPIAPHQFMPDLPPSSEVHSMVEDPNARPDARYKMLSCIFDREQLTLANKVSVSPDLIHWTDLTTVRWHSRGTEPVGSTLYDPEDRRFLILTRPEWGDRRIALVQTRDWETFTPPRLVMAPDSQDGQMAEHYGMYAFRCGQTKLGLLMVYQPTDHSTYCYKFDGGTIRCELIYSEDGEFWRRTQRVPFVGEENIMFWPSSSQVRDGYFYLYGTAAQVEHGDFCPVDHCSSLKIYRTPEHRFQSLAVKTGASYGELALRQNVLHSGTIHWNLKAVNATSAIYEVTREETKVLRSHEDCIPFTGDTIDWAPQWKGHDSEEDLQDRLLVFELRMDSGEVWSITGDFTRLGTTEAFRYEKFRMLPTRSGF